MKYFLKNLTPQDELPTPILNGSKILCIKYKSLKIIDSYSFIPIALSKFPKTFGIEEKAKGFFPFLFNSIKNANYIGQIPDKEFYDLKNMKDETRDTFIKFYELNKNKTFNLQDELIKYCKSDVDILKNGCLKQRLFLINASKKSEGDKGIDPYLNSITLPSFCHKLYRNLFMKEKSIAIIPEKGFNFNQINSQKAILWLEYISKRDNIFIKHARNGSEHQIKNFKLDGFDPLTRTAYEFHGW